MENVKDPMTLVRELVNLNSIYEKCLRKLINKFGLTYPPDYYKVHEEFSRESFLQTLSGQRIPEPQPWMGKTVTVKGHPEWGRGTIIALKRIGSWYIPGVEFDFSVVRGGHSLELRDSGIQGREGYCRWVYLDDLNISGT